MIRRFISNIYKSIYWITLLLVFNQFLSNANINPQISALNLLSTSKNKKWTQKKIKTKSKIPRYTKKDSRALSTMNEKQKNNSKSHHQSRPPNTKIACPYLRISTKHNHLFLGHHPNPRINEKERERKRKSKSNVRPESWWIFRRLGRFAVGVVSFKRSLLANYTLKRTTFSAGVARIRATKEAATVDPGLKV